MNNDVNDILVKINKELKTNLMIGDSELLATQRLSTGMVGVDNILGGGLPRQAVTELFGYHSTGKTYLAQRAIAGVQKQGYKCAFIDAEFSYDPEWSAKIGIDVSNLLVSRPETGERALDTLLALCEQGVDLVVLDSIAALLPTSEASQGMEHDSIGLQARLMNKLFRKLPSYNKNTAVILINQIRAGIGGYITRDALPGGKGQEFFARIMIRVKRGETIPNMGFFIELKAEKNKTWTPLMTCSVPFYFSGDSDSASEVFMLAVEANIIQRRGPQYNYNGTSTLGKEKFITLLREDEQLMKEIKEQVGNVE